MNKPHLHREGTVHRLQPTRGGVDTDCSQSPAVRDCRHHGRDSVQPRSSGHSSHDRRPARRPDGTDVAGVSWTRSPDRDNNDDDVVHASTPATPVYSALNRFMRAVLLHQHWALTTGLQLEENYKAQLYCSTSTALLGPFHGAIAVPSVTRCRRRCCCRGHRCAGGARQYR